MDLINTALRFVLSILNTIQFTDIIDIVIVAFLIYKGIQLVRETRAEQLIKGIVVLVLAYYLSLILGLKAMTFIMRNIVSFGVLALIVVFQPELRSALEHLGRTRFGRLPFLKFEKDENDIQKVQYAIYAVCEAAQMLQKSRFGALILFERETKLGEIVKTGTVINADMSPELVVNVFYPKSPLHDGAMVVRAGRLFAASCFLPLSQNQAISRELGTRHRAALGVSEISDALVVVVSEETGIISMASNGVIKRSLNKDTLRAALEAGILPQKPAEKKIGFKFFGR
ncbi:MAG: diadenylate cyclase CdaA [Clostridia bacterium]|nr:diadenylate cyclase CdaA [Clostridia bacterium]